MGGHWEKVVKNKKFNKKIKGNHGDGWINLNKINVITGSTQRIQNWPEPSIGISGFLGADRLKHNEKVMKVICMSITVYQ